MTLKTFNVITGPTTEVIKEDVYYPIKNEIEPPPNQSNKDRICQNSKFKYWNKDEFDIFYEDYIDFKNCINDILKINNLTQETEKTVALQT